YVRNALQAISLSLTSGRYSCMLFFSLDIESPARHGADHVVGQAPAELFRDFVAESLRSLRVVGAQIDVYESPIVLVSDLRAEPVHLIVAPGNANEFGAEHLRAEDLCRLEIGRNENPAFEAMPRSLCRRGVCKIASRGAGNRIEAEAASIRQSYGDHAVFKAQGGQADCVVLDQHVACANGT